MQCCATQHAFILYIGVQAVTEASTSRPGGHPSHSHATSAKQQLSKSLQTKPKGSKGKKRLQQSEAAPSGVATAAATGRQVSASANDANNLSKTDMAQLLALVQEASHHKPDPNVPSADAEASGSAVDMQATKKAIKKLSKATALTQTASAVALDSASNGLSLKGGQPKAKKQKSAVKPNRMTSTPSVPAEQPQATAAAAAHVDAAPRTVTEAVGSPADAAAAAAAVNSKQKKKLGRNARLRMKRQAFRQKHGQPAATEAASVIDVHGSVTGSDAQTVLKAEKPERSLARKATAETEQQGSPTLAKGKGPCANRQQASVSGQGPAVRGKSAVTSGTPGHLPADRLHNQEKRKSSNTLISQSPPQIADQLPSGEQSGSKKPKKSSSSLAGQRSTDATDAQPAGSVSVGKKKSKGLLDQMRSKLSGGRFRMLNQQLYTSRGQEAFDTMQAQPDLFQQYHEVTHCQLFSLLLDFLLDFLFASMLPAACF